jgi:hypothetical protein
MQSQYVLGGRSSAASSLSTTASPAPIPLSGSSPSSPRARSRGHSAGGWPRRARRPAWSRSQSMGSRPGRPRGLRPRGASRGHRVGRRELLGPLHGVRRGWLERVHRDPRVAPKDGPSRRYRPEPSSPLEQGSGVFQQSLADLTDPDSPIPPDLPTGPEQLPQVVPKYCFASNRLIGSMTDWTRFDPIDGEGLRRVSAMSIEFGRDETFTGPLAIERVAFPPVRPFVEPGRTCILRSRRLRLARIKFDGDTGPNTSNRVESGPIGRSTRLDRASENLISV